MRREGVGGRGAGCVFGGRWKGLKEGGKKREMNAVGLGCWRSWVWRRMDAGGNECERGMDSGEDDYGGSQMSEGCRMLERRNAGFEGFSRLMLRDEGGGGYILMDGSM